MKSISRHEVEAVLIISLDAILSDMTVLGSRRDESRYADEVIYRRIGTSVNLGFFKRCYRTRQCWAS